MPDILIQLLMVLYFTLKSVVWMTNYMVTIIIDDLLVYMSVLEHLTIRHASLTVTFACF